VKRVGLLNFYLKLSDYITGLPKDVRITFSERREEKFNIFPMRSSLG